jgi:hypothetical protein
MFTIICSLLDSLALRYTHSPLLYVSISTYAVHHSKIQEPFWQVKFRQLLLWILLGHVWLLLGHIWYLLWYSTSIHFRIFF